VWTALTDPLLNNPEVFMTHTFRALSVAGLVIAGAAGLTGCNAGVIVRPDGTAVSGSPSFSTVTFQSQTGGGEYTVNTGLTNNNMTFSFDPYGPPSATNGGLIPPDTYNVWLHLCNDANDCKWYGSNSSHGGFNSITIAYDGQCTDSYSGQTAYCNLFKFIACDQHHDPNDYLVYGSLCTDVTTTSDGVTTIGLMNGP
jgi:hypothetical protein